ncbi:MAG: IS21 family transposase [Oscillospiraceae bacterium]|jgi:transposase|nr:IS21 family transposase [Oscillospiraceae bacterium]
MVDYREILRLSADPNNSLRSIELMAHSDHRKIREIQDAARSADVSWALDESVTNEMLREVLFPNMASAAQVYVAPDYASIHRELARPGVNLTLLWTEYCAKCESQGKKPYQYTQFCEKYRQWARVTKATMRIQHKPGDTAEVDWAGNTLDIHDPVTGEVSKAYLLVAVLPCSGFTYVQLCNDMQLENWLLCHVHAYSYFGGVTRLLIPDNLKTGVKSNTRYETVLNRSYQELAEYYGTAIVPTRVRHPQDKSHAEGTVKIASTWILAALRDRWFFSVEEAQAAVSDKLEELNDKPFKNREGCRRSAYLDEEKEFMRPLPNAPYEAAVWSPELKVGLDYLVSDGLNKYSAPFDLIGEKVSLRLTKMLVEVFYRGTRVAVHTREGVALREPMVKPEHMTPEHRKYLNYNENNFILWAESVGSSAEKVVRYFLTSGKEAEQGFKACASMTRLAERYGTARLEKSCAYLLSFTATPSIRTLSTILKNGQKLGSAQGEPEKTERAEQHGITRGADYFRKGGASHG